VVDLPVAVAIGLGEVGGGVFDLVGVELVVAVGVEGAAKAITPLRWRTVGPLRGLGGDDLAAGCADEHDAKGEEGSHR